MPYKKTFRKRVFKKRIPKKSKKFDLKRFVKAIVKKEDNRRMETKEAFTYSNATFFNSGIEASGDMVQILPNISKGTADNQRIGDQIVAKSLSLKGFVRFLPQPTSATNDMHYGHVAIRLMVLSLKTAPNYTAAVANAAQLSNLLKKGGTTVAFTGAISDLYAPVNTDVFTVHYNKVYYVNQSFIMQMSGAGNQSAVSVDGSKLVKFFNIRIKCKDKILKYDAGTSSDVLPSNYGPFLSAGYVYLNGNAPDTLTTNLQIGYDSKFDYEDA